MSLLKLYHEHGLHQAPKFYKLIPYTGVMMYYFSYKELTVLCSSNCDTKGDTVISASDVDIISSSFVSSISLKLLIYCADHVAKSVHMCISLSYHSLL